MVVTALDRRDPLMRLACSRLRQPFSATGLRQLGAEPTLFALTIAMRIALPSSMRSSSRALRRPPQ
jgi:hypothetical protein